MTTRYPNWAKDQLMKDYYDQHWGYITHDEHEIFKMLTLEIFQAGLSWNTIWKRQDAFTKAFDNFDVATIAQYDGRKIDALLHDSSIIRNRRKIMATINNAKVLTKYHQQNKTLDHFLWSFVNGHPVQLHAKADTVLAPSTDLSKTVAKALKDAGFQLTGPTVIYSLLLAIGIVNGRIE